LLDEIDTISMLYEGLEDATVLHTVEDAKIMAPVETPARTNLGYISSGQEDEGGF